MEYPEKYQKKIDHIKKIAADEVNLSEDVLTEEVSDQVASLLPALRMIFTNDNRYPAVIKVFTSKTARQFLKDQKTFFKAFTKKTVIKKAEVVYHKPLMRKRGSGRSVSVGATVRSLISKLDKKGDASVIKIIGLPGIGILSLAYSAYEAQLLKEICKVQMSAAEAEELKDVPEDFWLETTDTVYDEVFRDIRQGKVCQKVVVITGGAQGFGGGIAEEMFSEGANVVVADISEEAGKKKVRELNKRALLNQAVFVKTNVADELSVQHLIDETVRTFGGLDVFISNAGILRAGSLEEMDVKTFKLMTDVNYVAYFICAKYASKVMKVQNEYKSDYLTDIIQINSKSGLKGSNKNFAYAGGKFGGIGLTESFALELMPHGIKVNAVCPGNFFDGPLWSDKKKGLFFQYLKAGKVPGAATVDDVKAYYESQVPAGRGCTPSDVTKAIYYIIEQPYETGQAVPVTGGQNMLK